MAAGVVAREIVMMKQQVEAVDLGPQEVVKMVREVGPLLVAAQGGISVDPMARDYREVGVYPVQVYPVWVRKEVYSLKRLADAV